MRFVIYGAGGIGSGLGGHLHRTGHDAILVGRPGHVAAIRGKGLTLVTPDETFHLRVPAVVSAAEVGFRDGDAVLLCVKSQDTDQALREIRAAGGDPQTLPIFCCQNGITNEPAALRYFRHVYGVMNFIPGVYLHDGVVHNPIRGNAGTCDVGCYPANLDGVALDVVAALCAASYAAEASADVMPAKGRKMIGNLGNALGAITDGRGDPQARGRYLMEVRREGETCLRAAGLPAESHESFEARIHTRHGQEELPGDVRNLGSSWQSLRRRQGSIEADFLNGEIVRLGRLHGIRAAYNEVLQEVANQMAGRRQAPGRFTADDLETLAGQRAGESG